MSASVEQIEKALCDSGGNVSAAARAIGLSRRQVHRRIDDTAALRELIHDLRESVADAAEQCIFQAIQAGDAKQAQWFLLSSAVGRARGYAKDRASDLDNVQDTPRIVEVVVENPDQVKRMMNYQEWEEFTQG